MPNEGVEKSHESKNGKIRGLKTIAPLEIVANSANDEVEILVELFNSLFFYSLNDLLERRFTA